VPRPEDVFADQVEWMLAGGGLDWCTARIADSARRLYDWADACDYATPFVADPGSGASTRNSRRAERDHPAPAGNERTELQRGEEVVTLQVRIVGEHLVDRHTGRQELQQALDGVTQTPDRRLTMTDRWVRRDAIQPRHVTTVPPQHAIAGIVRQVGRPSACRQRSTSTAENAVTGVERLSTPIMGIQVPSLFDTTPTSNTRSPPRRGWVGETRGGWETLGP